MIGALYQPILEALGVPPQAKALGQGTLKIPMATYGPPEAAFGFPPALIPLCSVSGPVQIGYWRHFFCERVPTMARVSVEGGYTAMEISRTFEQFSSLLVLEKIVADGDLTDEASSFGGRLGLSTARIRELDAISIQLGDRPSALLSLFQSDSPLRTCLDAGVSYAGDFPDPRLDGRNALTCAGLELASEARQRAASIRKSPWLQNGSQPPIFDRLLAQGDLAGAWMSLNSPGWRFSDASAALMRLAHEGRDPALNALTKAWTACAVDMPGTY